MGRFTSENAKVMGARGGRAKANNEKAQTKTYQDVVNEQTSDKDLLDLYNAVMASGKKGNIKAVENILRYLDKKDDKPMSLEEMIDSD